MSTQDALQAALEPISTIRLAVLFGSAARGTTSQRSDLDVGISIHGGGVLPPDTVVDVERAADRIVDVISLDAAPPLLRFEIARTGLVLIERDPHAWADFQARALIDWWDWAPTARIIREATIARLREEVRRGAP